MEKPPDKVASEYRSLRILVVSFLVLFAVGCAVWPSFKLAARTSLNVITKPFVKVLFPNKKQGSLDSTNSGQLARNARSMEFRIQQYPVTPALLSSWCNEWNCKDTDKKILLTLLLRTLPEAVSSDTPSPDRVNLIQSMGQITQEGMKTQPNNAYYLLVNGLILFYTGQDAQAFDLLKQSQAMPTIDSGLKDLNQAENFLWINDTKLESIFPRMPQIWGLRLERPFHTWSRGLVLQERAYLQKYNIEKAVETTMVHLALAKQISDMAWTPFDFALSQAIKNRALDAYWTQKGGEPNSKQLEDNFLYFLEEQADKLAAAKARSWIEEINHREAEKLQKLPRWRLVQSFSSWNASGILASLYLQTVSLFIVWMTMTLSFRPSSADKVAAGPSLVPSMIFFAAPIAWMFSGWPVSGTLMLLGILITWLIWIFLLSLGNRNQKLGADQITLSVSYSLASILTSAVLVTAIAAYALDYRLAMLKDLGH